MFEALRHTAWLYESEIARVQYLVDWMDSQGMLSEHCFTFPDGVTVWATQEVTSDITG